jgi:hypothetical protein
MIRSEYKNGDLLEVGVDVEGGDRRLPSVRGRSNGCGWSLGVGGIRRNSKNNGTEKQPGFMWATSSNREHNSWRHHRDIMAE